MERMDSTVKFNQTEDNKCEDTVVEEDKVMPANLA